MPNLPQRQYRPAAESREKLLEAGAELLRERGLVPGITSVSLNDAIEHSGMARTTAYRIYSGDRESGAIFRLDLLAYLVRTHVDRDRTFAEVANVIEREAEAIESQDPAQLARVLREVIRVGVEASYKGFSGSLEYFVVASSMAAASAPHSQMDDELEILRETMEVVQREIAPLFESLASLFGLRLRDGLSWFRFATLFAALQEGIANRQTVDPSLMTFERSTGDDGALQTWHASAIAFEGMVRIWCEPDPEAEASADLSLW